MVQKLIERRHFGAFLDRISFILDRILKYLIGEKQNMNTNHQYAGSLPMTLLVEDLMSLLGIGRNTAYHLVRSGEIRSIKIGRQIRIPRQALLDYLEQK